MRPLWVPPPILRKRPTHYDMITRFAFLTPAKLPFLLVIPCILTALLGQYLALPHANASNALVTYQLGLPDIGAPDNGSVLYVRVPTLTTEQEDFEAHFSIVPAARDVSVQLTVTEDSIDPLRFEWKGEEDGSTLRLKLDHAGQTRLKLVGSFQQRFQSSRSVQSINQQIPIAIAASLRHRMEVGIYIFVPLYAVVLVATLVISSIRREQHALAQKVEDAENKANTAPEKAKYAWDAARVNLEAYFERNRLQVAQVFIIAVVVMLIGFVLVCFGVFLAMTRPDTIKPALVAGVSGIITQFIGATFMVIMKLLPCSFCNSLYHSQQMLIWSPIRIRENEFLVGIIFSPFLNRFDQVGWNWDSPALPMLWVPTVLRLVRDVEEIISDVGVLSVSSLTVPYSGLEEIIESESLLVIEDRSVHGTDLSGVVINDWLRHVPGIFGFFQYLSYAERLQKNYGVIDLVEIGPVGVS